MKKSITMIVSYLLIITCLVLGIYVGNRTISVISQQLPFSRAYSIVIDPGHGGEDGGAISYTGVPESRLNMDISLRLRDLLHFLGYNTVMTRISDESIHIQGNTISARKMSDLKERVRIVNETENAHLISIHQNTFSDSRYNGAQVFYSKNGDSQRLAKKMQNAFSKCLMPENHREIKKAEGIYLMEHIDRPGVLIECGFLSNPEEEGKLRDPIYQRKIACVVASQIAEFSVLDAHSKG